MLCTVGQKTDNMVRERKKGPCKFITSFLSLPILGFMITPSVIPSSSQKAGPNKAPTDFKKRTAKVGKRAMAPATSTSTKFQAKRIAMPGGYLELPIKSRTANNRRQSAI